MKNNVFYFKSKDSDLQVKKVNKKRIVLIVIICIIVVTSISLLIIYSKNEAFRNFWDYTVLRKEVISADVKSLILEKDGLRYVSTCDRNLVILEKNVLKYYNQDGNVEGEIQLNIATPLYSNNNKYLAVAEKNGKKVYLINDKNIVWQKDLDGTISQVYVNKNGYVGVIMSATGYKTVIVLYTPSGEELFRTNLPTTYCSDIEISNDNKYMAIAELDSSGTMIETSIRIISIEDAKTKPQEAFIATYDQNSPNMILNLKYTDNNRLISMYDNAISFPGENTEEILSISSDVIFADIESANRVVSIEKQKAGILSSNYILKIYDTVYDKTLEYNLEDMPKDLYVKDNIIAVSYGTDVEIISASSGWLIKKYVSRQDIKNVLIANGFVAIEYSDEIKLIKI